MNYYETLGVDRNASPDEIKSAYKKLAKDYHPDSPNGDADKMKAINEAYNTLKNDESRRKYDFETSGPRFANSAGGDYEWFELDEEALREAMQAHVRGDGNMGNFFSQMYGGHHRPPARNPDIHITLNVNLEDIADTEYKTNVSVRHQDGTREIVDISVPSHIDHGRTMRVEGLGDNTNPSLTRGDLYVTVLFIDHPRYEKRGLDLITTIHIDSLEAILGCEKIVKAVSGRNLKLKIPAGTQYGQILNLNGEGIKFKDRQGNIYSQIVIKTPKNLSPEQLEHIRKAQEPNG